MRALEYLVEQVARLSDRLDRQPQFTWGTVDSVSPVRVRIDGSDPVSAPHCLVHGVRQGDRVLCVLVGNRLTVIGVDGGIVS